MHPIRLRRRLSDRAASLKLAIRRSKDDAACNELRFEGHRSQSARGRALERALAQSFEQRRVTIRMRYEINGPGLEDRIIFSAAGLFMLCGAA